MDELITWLKDCLDEDEIGATAAGVVPEARDWAAGPDHVEDDERVRVAAFIDSEETPLTAARALHIARWDPARVLREVAAKRQILDDVVPQINAMDDKIEDEWGTGGEGPHEESWLLLRLLALSFADRPGYQESWRP